MREHASAQEKSARENENENRTENSDSESSCEGHLTSLAVRVAFNISGVDTSGIPEMLCTNTSSPFSVEDL